MREQRALLAERGHTREHIKPEITALELALADISPFDDRDRAAPLTIFGDSFHRHRVAMDQVERQDVPSRTV